MERKKRLCNMSRCPGSSYCGNHLPAGEKSKSLRVVHRAGLDEVVRVPCPIDPSHTIYKHDMEGHVNKCNVKVQSDFLKSQDFYKENCNSGEVPIYNSNDSRPGVTPDELVRKIKFVYTDRVCVDFGDEYHISDLKIETDVTNAVALNQTSESRLRHAKQDVRIVNQMIGYNLLKIGLNSGGKAEDALYVEFGAGKGMLGLSIKAVMPTAELIFVERSGQRGKADRLLRQRGLTFQRIRTDIRHFSLWDTAVVKEHAEKVTVTTSD